jgi:mono/diheme cytochrome c family protein
MIGTALAGLLLAGISSCGKRDANSPGFEYMPDMYRSPSLEYYQVHTVDGDTLQNAMLPVPGTVARGYIPYMYPNTPEGYEAAGNMLHNPLPADRREDWEMEGAEIYSKFCIQCHGASGMGDGKVGLKLPGPPPAYSSAAIKNLPEGKIFHSITYGKNLMGAHQSLLSQEERWKLVYYIQKLQGSSKTASDSTKTAAPAAAAKGAPSDSTEAKK